MLTEQNLSKLFMLVVDVKCDDKIIFSSHLRSPHKNTEELYSLLYDVFDFISTELRESYGGAEYFKIIANDEEVAHIQIMNGCMLKKAFSAMIKIAQDVNSIYSEYENFGKTYHPFGNLNMRREKEDCIGLHEKVKTDNSLVYNEMGDPAMKEVGKDKLLVE